MSFAASSVVVCKHTYFQEGVSQKNVGVEMAYHMLSVICIGETYTDGLVNEEYVRSGVPRFRMVLRSVRIQNSTRPELHEKAQRRRRPWT